MVKKHIPIPNDVGFWTVDQLWLLQTSLTMGDVFKTGCVLYTFLGMSEIETTVDFSCSFLLCIVFLSSPSLANTPKCAYPVSSLSCGLCYKIWVRSALESQLKHNHHHHHNHNKTCTVLSAGTMWLGSQHSDLVTWCFMIWHWTGYLPFPSVSCIWRVKRG